MNRKSTALFAAKKASEFLKKQFRIVRTGTKKTDGSLVSEADSGAEKLLLTEIKKNFPGDGILSEESPEVKGSTNYRWIIDPLDGTHNFLAGSQLFGSLLALEYNNEVILSVCIFPMLNEIFVAEKGRGARLNNRLIHVSKETSFEGNIFLSDGNLRRARDKVLSDIEALADQGCRIRILGSSAFSMTRVAVGGVIAATNRVAKPWDIAAPALLVEEAGGKVTDMQGKRWQINSKMVLATNGRLHSRTLKFLKD